MIKSVLVTAGPTRERIDPVRFLSNYSTGRFGYEIAAEAHRMGLETVLVSGPTCLDAPRGVKRVMVESALDMKRAVEREFDHCFIVIMAAAVSDWRVKKSAGKKIKRGSRPKALELVENPDILAGLGKRKGKRVIVGFALETDNAAENALEKLRKKNLDMIVANTATGGRGAFGPGRTSVVIFDRFNRKAAYNNRTKNELAKIILDKALALNIGYGI
jgi:phosphopantothenoylcysteine decarboxylase / phosphopantothenate---cysteine ligase